MIAQIGVGRSARSAQSSTARHASPAMPWPWTAGSKIQPISGKSPKSGVQPALEIEEADAARPAGRRPCARPPNCRSRGSATARPPSSAAPALLAAQSARRRGDASTSGSAERSLHGRRGRRGEMRARRSRSVSRVGAERDRRVSRKADPPDGDRALLLAEREAAEALVEARDLAAGVEHLAAAAGPRRVRRRVDFEVQRVAFLAPRRAGLVASCRRSFGR